MAYRQIVAAPNHGGVGTNLSGEFSREVEAPIISREVETPIIVQNLGQESDYEIAMRALLTRTGYRLSQKCGQSIYSQPPNWNGPPPPRGSEVFLCIARDSFIFDLEPILSLFGQIYELRMMVDFSGTSRGYAYVRYASPDVARTAVNGLKATKFRTLVKKAAISDDNSEVFVLGIPQHLTRDDLYEYFSKITERLCSVTICKSRNEQMANRGFCFLMYVNHSYAAQARRELLQDLHVQEWRTTLVCVSWGIPYKLKYPSSDSRKIYVCNLPLHFNYTKLLHVLAEYTDISYVMNGKVACGKGFIEFTHHDEANYALHILTAVPIEGQNLSASWARPMQRSRDRDQILNLHADSNALCLRAGKEGSDHSSSRSQYSASPSPCPLAAIEYPQCYSGNGYGGNATASNYRTGVSYQTPVTGNDASYTHGYSHSPSDASSNSYSDAAYYGTGTSAAGYYSGSSYPQSDDAAYYGSYMQPQQQEPVPALSQGVAPSNPRYRGATPLPDVLATRFLAVQNVNYGSSLSPYSPATPVGYAQYNLWSPQPLTPSQMSAPRSKAFVFPPPPSPIYQTVPRVSPVPPAPAPAPLSPTTPVYNPPGNYFFF